MGDQLALKQIRDFWSLMKKILLSSFALTLCGVGNANMKYKPTQKNIKEWLEILPSRYLTFSCESTERKQVLENPDIIDVENHFICSGQPEGKEPIPGEICFSLKSFPYKNGTELLIVTNERFDEFCTELDHFFLVFSEGKWMEVPVSELFEIAIQAPKSYYPKDNIPILYQSESESDFSAQYMLRLNPVENALTATLAICDFYEPEEVDENLIDALWMDLKTLEFLWNEDLNKFLVRE